MFRLIRFALKREATAADLTTARLKIVEKRLAERYSRSVIDAAMKAVLALWRFITESGESIEAAPKRNELRPAPGRAKRIRFESFDRIVGLKVTPADAPASVQNELEVPILKLPTIDGPNADDFAQYRREVEAAREAQRAEIKRLAGTLLFCWGSLYCEWAEIGDGGVRNHWRFALLRFAEFLKRPAELSDLTEMNLTDLHQWLVSHGRSSESARLVTAKLRTVWRFAWEAQAIELPPPGRLYHRWSMARLGRPSPEKEMRTCARCGLEFRPKKKSHVACSRNCRRALYEKRRTQERREARGPRTCPNCGVEFQPTHRSDQETCSRRCRFEWYEKRRKARRKAS